MEGFVKVPVPRAVADTIEVVTRSTEGGAGFARWRKIADMSGPWIEEELPEGIQCKRVEGTEFAVEVRGARDAAQERREEEEEGRKKEGEKERKEKGQNDKEVEQSERKKDGESGREAVRGKERKGVVDEGEQREAEKFDQVVMDWVAVRRRTESRTQ